jgi:hypothetical protein
VVTLAYHGLVRQWRAILPSERLGLQLGERLSAGRPHDLVGAAGTVRRRPGADDP